MARRLYSLVPRTRKYIFYMNIKIFYFKKIKTETRELFHKTESCVQRLKVQEYKQVTLMRTLCNADLRKLNKAMENIYELEKDLKTVWNFLNYM